MALGRDERSRALDDELEHRVDVGLAAERQRDVHHRRERRDALLELVAPTGDALVDASVLDRDRGPAGERDEGVLVGLVERTGALLGRGRGCRTRCRR